MRKNVSTDILLTHVTSGREEVVKKVLIASFDTRRMKSMKKNQLKPQNVKDLSPSNLLHNKVRLKELRLMIPLFYTKP